MVFWGNSSAEESLSETNSDENSMIINKELDSLEVRIKQTIRTEDKYAILKEVVAQDIKFGKELLIKYFNSLPPSESSTNPKSDFYKVGVFEIIYPLIDEEEKKLFIQSVLDTELINMHKAHIDGYGNMYPLTLWKKMLTVIEPNESEWNMQERISAIAEDSTLPSQVRVAAKASSLRNDNRVNSDTNEKKIQNILQQIPLKPEHSVPWEHFKDLNKRRSYYQSQAFMSATKEYTSWRDSGQEIIYKGQLEFLLCQRLKSVEQIVLLLESNALSRERKDGLVVVVAWILARLKTLTSQERYLADQLVGKLENYIDNMDDKGAFCRREKAILSLRGYYRDIGIAGYPFQEGRSTQKTLFSTAEMQTVLASNMTAGGSSLLINSMKQPQDGSVSEPELQTVAKNNFFTVCTVIILLCLLGVIFAIYWMHMKQK